MGGVTEDSRRIELWLPRGGMEEGIERLGAKDDGAGGHSTNK